MPDYLEMLVIEQMLDVAAGDEIIDADDDRPIAEQVAQMRAHEPGAVGY